MKNKMIALGFGIALAATAAVGYAQENGMIPQMGGKIGPMADFATLDANKDGKLTAEELAAAESARFALADADKDGKISAAELTAMIQQQMLARAGDMAARQLAERDANKDGVLTPDEMARPQMAGRMLQMADTDGDGAISEAEFDAAKARMAERGHGKGERGGKGHGKRGGHGHGENHGHGKGQMQGMGGNG